MPDLLFEIGCEELPATACHEAAAQLPALVREHVGAEPDELFIGPRRLAFLVRDLAAETPEQWLQGPPLRIGEQAAEGFARKLGVARSDLVERDGVLGWVKPPQRIADTLPERLQAIVEGLRFGKSMVWEAGGMRFSRPVRWTLAKLDAETIVGTHSYGHRFGSGPVEIPRADAYADTLRANGVEPSAELRRQAIVAGLDAAGDWSDPAGVLAEVVMLVERPSVLVGSFDERFLQLPPRVVQTAMQSHQRYFPRGGNSFAFVANGGDPDVVRAGNEQVLVGRLEDAAFTFDRDVSAGIEALVGRLGSITFFKGAGSYADKTVRLVALAARLGGDADALEAARLAKADQAAELVREFPDLEGHIGAQYARLAGASEAVCAAIEEHYLPDSGGGPLPSTESGRVVAAADKLDTLVTAFSLGHRPTGSRDPYALRRAAIGLCRLAIEGDVPVVIDDADVRGFVLERLEGLLDVPVEFTRAAVATGSPAPGEVARQALFLAGLDPESLATVQEAYTRSKRIVGDVADDAAVDPGLFRDEAERVLFGCLAAVATAEAMDAVLAWALTLAPVLARFFEDVLVMDEDAAVRANRLRLLRDVRDRVGVLGDLSELPG